MSKIITMGEEFLERRNRITKNANDDYADYLKSLTDSCFARYPMMETSRAEDRKFAVRYVKYLTGEQVWSEEAMADWEDW